MTIKFDSQAGQKLALKISFPITNAKGFFQLLGVQIDNHVQDTFNRQGKNLPAGSRWKGFEQSTLKTKVGTPKIRYGSDTKPKRTRKELDAYKTANNLWYKRGPMKGYENAQRYDTSSRLLQSSGSFRKSWKVLKVTNKTLKYGSQYKNTKTKVNAEKIMSGGGKNRREVLVFSQNKINQFKKLFVQWYKQGIAF